MKHAAKLQILVNNNKAYLSYEIISHLNLAPGERISIIENKRRMYLKIHCPSDRSGLKLKIENQNGFVGFFIKMKNAIPKARYVFNSNIGTEDSDGNYLAPLRAANL